MSAIHASAGNVSSPVNSPYLLPAMRLAASLRTSDLECLIDPLVLDKKDVIDDEKVLTACIVASSIDEDSEAEARSVCGADTVGGTGVPVWP